MLELIVRPFTCLVVATLKKMIIVSLCQLLDKTRRLNKRADNFHRVRLLRNDTSSGIQAIQHVKYMITAVRSLAVTEAVGMIILCNYLAGKPPLPIAMIRLYERDRASSLIANLPEESLDKTEAGVKPPLGVDNEDRFLTSLDALVYLKQMQIILQNAVRTFHQ